MSINLNKFINNYNWHLEAVGLHMDFTFSKLNIYNLPSTQNEKSMAELAIKTISSIFPFHNTWVIISK